jgi:N-acetylglucosamine kinase-like BadF-type ATPase
MPQYFLGVDGGQSSTVALIGDERGVVLGYGAAGPSNHVEGPGGREKLRKAVTLSVSAAWNNSPFGTGKKLPEFESCFFGMTGGAEDKVAIIRELIPARKLEVSHDAITALVGATEGEPGIIVIAGTGSISFGMNARGQTARAGGWGYIFGDRGSAFDLARQALVAALAYEEGWGPATSLRDKIIAFSGATDLNDALHKWYKVDFPRDRVASFSRYVDEAAREGDRVAREILRSAASELAQLAGRVRRRAFKPKEPVVVSYIGGVWKSKIVRDRFKKLVEETEGNRVQPPALGPAAGALLAAYKNAGLRDIRLKNLPPEL